MKFKPLIISLAILIVLTSWMGVVHSQVLSKSVEYGQLCSQRVLQTLLFRLQKSHVKVNILGDHIFFVIPSHKIFYRDSTHFNMSSKRVLNEIVQALQCYQKVSVRVVAYADILKNEQENSSFALLQAKQVANHLWQKNVGAQLISSEGIGGLKNSQRSVGYIEIITQKLP